MIIFTLLKAGDEILGFECKGHAGYARAGRDIVCAGVSMLTVTCANALESVAHASPIVSSEDGFLSVFLPENSRTRDAQVILMTLNQGMQDLKAAYPKYVTLTEKFVMEE